MKNNIVVISLALIIALAVVGEANDANNGASPENAKNLIVGFRDGIPQGIHGMVKAHGAIVVSKNTDINFVVVDPNGRNKAELIKEMSGLPHAAYVEEDHISTIFLNPNDPFYYKQWGPADINAPQAWDINTGSKNVKIAIIDTGVDYNHEDLAANIWINPSETPGNNADDDSNGYIDDIHGWNFAYNNNNPIDDHGHGSHVAGIAAAITNNGIGIAGISQSSIVVIKVCDNKGSCPNSAIADGITYAANNGAKVISLSLGGRFSSLAESNAVNYAWGKGAVIVASAGNDNSGKISYPAAYSKVIAVSALDPGDAFAYYSNHGSKIELSAPGTGIYSTYKEGGYATMSGTSMAAPFVSGSAALVLSKNSGLSNQDVRNILDKTAVDLGKKGRDAYFGFGKVNPYGALSQTP